MKTGRQTKLGEQRLKAFRKIQFNKPPEKCPTCGKELKYETNVLKAIISRQMTQEHGIIIKRHNIAAAARCCNVGWVKLKTGY